MQWPFHNPKLSRYWLRVFGWYVITEACIQLLFLFVLNQFGEAPISNIEFHAVMWVFQCLTILPIWWVAQSLYKRKLALQIVGNLLFFVVYIFVWISYIQEPVRDLHQAIQRVTSPDERINTPVDSFSYFNHHILKHCFRLSWFFLANYFYNYREEENKRRELALANKELELKLLTWRLNPDFYLHAISHLQRLAIQSPGACTNPLLQLAKVMEYVIYEAKEKMISVTRELDFLTSYVDLLNKQKPAGQKIELSHAGDHGKLNISPLLLVEFIDKLSDSNFRDSTYRLHLEFAGSWLRFSIYGEKIALRHNWLNSDDSLYRRITEVYAGRFLLAPDTDNNIVHLKIHLDEQA